MHPIEKPLLESAAVVLRNPEFTVRREMRKIGGGDELFCQIMTSNGKAPSHVLVFFHGYTENSDLFLEFCSHLAHDGAAVILVDMPGYGFSDGLLAYTKDWWAFIDQIWALLDVVVPEVSAGSLKVFGCGMSLGGGVLACLTLQRPDFFAGVCLLAPMLYVADDVKPPQVVQQLLKLFIAPLLPSWPITPGEELEGRDFRIAAQGHAFTQHGNPLSMQGCKLRLATAVQMGLVFPDWMGKRLGQVSTPFLVVHSKDDLICDPAVSQMLYDQACAKDKTLKLVPDSFHCELCSCLPGVEKSLGMEFTPEQHAITKLCLEEISGWISKRV